MRYLWLAALLLIAPVLLWSEGVEDSSDDPLSKTQEEIRSSVRFKKPKPAVAPAEEETVSWNQAKPKIIEAWKDVIKRLKTTQEQAQFLAGHDVGIVFVPLDKKKWGTFNRELRQAQFNDSLYEWQWRDLQSNSLSSREAARVLALKSLPSFAHVLRDQMMTEDLEARGFIATGGWLEDEVIHNKEMARVVVELREMFPAAQPKIHLDEELDNTVAIAARGNAALANDLVRRYYIGMRSLFNKNDVNLLKSEFEDCQETSAKGGCESRDLSVLLGLDRKKAEKFIFGPGVPCFYEYESSDNGTFAGVDVLGRGSLPSPYASQHLPPSLALPQKLSSWSYHRCDKDWSAWVKFLNNDAELDRLRQYYRQMLGQYDITPDELNGSRER